MFQSGISVINKKMCVWIGILSHNVQIVFQRYAAVLVFQSPAEFYELIDGIHRLLGALAQRFPVQQVCDEDG